MVVGKHLLGHKSACLVSWGIPHRAPVLTPARAGTEQSGQPGLAGDRSPCPSLSGCVLCKTTFLLGLTRDLPHPPMGGSCHILPGPRRLTPSPCVLLLQKAQTKAWLLLRPGPGAQPGAQGSQGLHLPAPHPLACLSVLLACPKGASDSGARPGCGCGQWTVQAGDRTSHPEQQMKGLFLVRLLLSPALLAPSFPLETLRLRGD